MYFVFLVDCSHKICSLIGGFFLLRFVNPAIVTPQAFLLVESKLSAETKRNLTLVAKLLQNVANNVKFGGVKEQFMAPLNAFLNAVQSRVNDFFDELTRVQSLDERLALDQYLSLAKRDKELIHIALNEVYNCHRLLAQHVDVIAPAADDALRVALNALGAAPEQV